MRQNQQIKKTSEQEVDNSPNIVSNRKLRQLMGWVGAVTILAACSNGNAAKDPTYETKVPITVETTIDTSPTTTTIIKTPAVISTSSTTEVPITVAPETTIPSPEIKKPVAGERYATMSIPKMGLQAGIYGFDGGEDSAVLNNENAQFQGQVEPVVGIGVNNDGPGINDGLSHNTIMFGHRMTHSHPAKLINTLVQGDTMTIELTRPKTDDPTQSEVYKTQEWMMTDSANVLAADSNAIYGALYNHQPNLVEGNPEASNDQLIFYGCSNSDGGTGDPAIAGSYKADYRYITYWQPVPVPNS